MKYFVLLGPGLFLALLAFNTFKMTRDYWRGRLAGNRAIKSEMGLNSLPDEQENSDYKWGFQAAICNARKRLIGSCQGSCCGA